MKIAFDTSSITALYFYKHKDRILNHLISRGNEPVITAVNAVVSFVRKHKLEKIAYKSAGVKVFVLTSGNVKGRVIIDIIINNLNKILRLARKNSGPFIAAVRPSGVAIYLY